MLLHRLRGKKARDPLADPESRLQKSKKDLACRFLARFKGSRGASSNINPTPSPRPVFHLSGNGTSEDHLINSDLLRTLPRAQSATYPPFSLLGDIEELPTSDISLIPSSRAFSASRDETKSIQDSLLELKLQSIMSTSPKPALVASIIGATEAGETSVLKLADIDVMQISEIREISAQESGLMLKDESTDSSVESLDMTRDGEATETPQLCPLSFRNSKVSYESIAYPIMLENIKMGACNAQSFETLFKFIRVAALGDIPRLELEFGYALKYLLVSRFPNDAFKATEPYQEALCSFVRLLHNGTILNLALETEMLEVVDWMLHSGTSKVKENAVILILEASTCDRDRFNQALSVFPHRLVSSIVGIVLDMPRPRLALKALLSLCLFPANRAAAVEAGAIAAFAKIIPRENDFELTSTMLETCLTILTFLSTIPEGIRSMREHETFVLVLVDVILRVSDGVTECAVDILYKLCTPSSDADVVRTQERVVQAGARNRLLLVLQCNGTRKSKAIAQELLKVLLHFWLQGPVRPTDSTSVEFFKM